MPPKRVSTPDDPETYERDVCAATEDQLRRVLDELGLGERQELREVRLEGSYPTTEVLVTIWDTRLSNNPREVTYRKRVWAFPHYRPEKGILEPPDHAAENVVRHVLGD
jgi:hypothetical protein